MNILWLKGQNRAHSGIVLRKWKLLHLHLFQGRLTWGNDCCPSTLWKDRIEANLKENEGEDKSLKSRNENRNYFSVIKWLLFVRIFNWRKRKWSQVLSCKFSQNSGTSYFPVSSPNEISCLCMIYLALTNPKHQNPATKPTGCWDVVVVQHVLVGLSWQSTFVWMNTFC